MLYFFDLDRLIIFYKKFHDKLINALKKSMALLGRIKLTFPRTILAIHSRRFKVTRDLVNETRSKRFFWLFLKEGFHFLSYA